jgi:hypothetical protein
MLNYTDWEKSYEDMLAEAEFIIESKREEEQLRRLEEKQNV